MTDLNTNLYTVIKKIFFKSYAIFFINFFSLIFILAILSTLQYNSLKSRNSLFKHTIIIEDVPIIPKNDKIIKIDNFRLQVLVVPNEFKESNLNVYDIHAKFYDNSSKKRSEISKKMIILVKNNFDEQINDLSTELEFRKLNDLQNPLNIFLTERKISKLRNIEPYVTYSIVRKESISNIISKSFIISFIIILIGRIFYLEITSSRGKKN